MYLPNYKDTPGKKKTKTQSIYSNRDNEGQPLALGAPHVQKNLSRIYMNLSMCPNLDHF
jgi:hypothetical protein